MKGRINRYPAEERGSTMIVAMAVILIMGIVATSIWAKTLGGLSQARFEQRRLAAFASANSGLDEAVFRIEQLSLEDLPDDYSFTGSGNNDSGDYSYSVVRTGERSWTVLSTGRSAAGMRTVRADVVTFSRYDHAVAGNKVTVRGNPKDDAGGICAYDSRDSVDEKQCPPEDIAMLGSYSEEGSPGLLNCSGQGWDEVKMMLYPGAQASGCGEENVLRSDQDMFLEQPTVPADAVYPNTGVDASGNCNFTPTTFAALVGGFTYKCNNLRFTSNPNNYCSAPNVTQDNPIIIYVTGSITFERDVRVNVDNGIADGDGCDRRPKAGPNVAGWYPTTQPGGLRIIQTCDRNTTIGLPGGQNQPIVSMILDAQCAQWVSAGGPHLYLFGAAVVSEFTDNGALRVLAYDKRITEIVIHKYYVKNWREVPLVEDPTAPEVLASLRLQAL